MKAAQLPFQIDGRRALVTGASRGIGRAIAIGLGQMGAEVLVHYHRDRIAADEVVRIIREDGGTANLLQQNLEEPHSGQALGLAALANGSVDVVVLNAAIQERRVLADVDYDLFLRHAHANFWSGLQLIQAIVPGMQQKGWGRIVAIGSVQQIRPNPNLLIYAGLKSALSNVMRGLSKAYAGSGITANCLAPGLIETDRVEDIKADPALYQSILDRIPAGYAGIPNDCVGAALLLCSDAGRYITGIDLLVDGGMHIP